ncbi:MAG TPA: helix-turn-helix transcriptional regulator, partial [Thermoanaerobaculia bacterium]|nr:helix-turn-helix transcriptional regulator [Thermoanaerobaculia bacterium]
QKDEDMKRALWGLAMTEAELGIETVDAHIDALEALAADDINTKLRVGLGRQMVAANRGSFKGIWRIISPLTALADHADDPMAQTTLWANASYLCIARVDYGRGFALALRAFEACEAFRLDFARGYCLGYLASAEIGQRRFRSAANRLRELWLLAEEQDNSYMRVMHAVMSIRLALAKSTPSRALEVVPEFDDSRVPSAALGELLSILAVANAAGGRADTALTYCDQARSLTQAVETSFYTASAELIVSASRKHSSSLGSRAAALLERAREADFLDAFVVSYRAFPGLLSLLSAAPPPVLRAVLRQARDLPLARRYGIEGGATRPAAAQLTPRETEVLTLLARGLTNAQIAQHLFIAESTAKVHVHHILEKLGVRTRLQAVLAVQDD